ncbi:riboflavin biosynthesis protein RibD [Bacillus sp. J14TS2]|uniref:bifunctional diaminohydroxyphosphoribosylaminopyrimidine deaminase/5-amino-6-(5-phosphoribosylamino)uracil reductase RibD n=1 Tax=Bacillus sp. J14TS2 TaxID=2807188 RepID=UPI001B0D821A|nr:bifunctional diaminohydroxyphosphoribosylaminopyrimidine deaminase/5-amino-6-(5-phosphoribosylamino)uracil reductase RibD [Bacillus sp. J14TS2]GIN73053.1 riboflavin biosynthesis protein RibD [Bacillus sp. J14TS2]
MLKENYMELALSLARTVAGQTSPNPPVGAVVVKNGQIIGMGAHLKAGEAHAEQIALQMAGDEARDADLYVTLEPCAHMGKTPPCADAVIAYGIKHVWVATQDPNPLVAGKGIQRMEDAMIQVDIGLYGQEAAQLYAPFFHYIQTKQPYVTMKIAMTLDGKIATATGDSRWITSDQARLDVHLLRAAHDAILVGVQTILHDDPLLTTRLPQGGKNPIRVILDTHLRTPINSQIVQNDEAPTLIFCGQQAASKRQQLLEQGSQVKVVRLATERISVPEILNELAKHNIMKLLVEGGATIHAAFLKSQKIQKVIVYVAPKLLGGKQSLPSITGENLLSMSEARPFIFENVEMIGPDIKITALPKGSEQNVYRDH